MFSEEIYSPRKKDLIRYGFATFFLSRGMVLEYSITLHSIEDDDLRLNLMEKFVTETFKLYQQPKYLPREKRELGYLIPIKNLEKELACFEDTFSSTKDNNHHRIPYSLIN